MIIRYDRLFLIKVQFNIQYYNIWLSSQLYYLKNYVTVQQGSLQCNQNGKQRRQPIINHRTGSTQNNQNGRENINSNNSIRFISFIYESHSKHFNIINEQYSLI